MYIVAYIVPVCIILIVMVLNGITDKDLINYSNSSKGQREDFYYFKRDNICYLAHNKPSQASFAFSQTDESKCNNLTEE